MWNWLEVVDGAGGHALASRHSIAEAKTVGTCDVKADLATNRLYVTLAGFSNDQEMEQHLARVAAEVRKLAPGFIMISNISQMKSTTPHGTKLLQDIMQLYKKHGIAKIIRIVGDDVIAKSQFNRLSKEASIPVDYVHSMAEAEKLATA